MTFNARCCQIVKNDKHSTLSSYLSLHKKININIRHNLQKKLFWLILLEFLQILKYSIIAFKYDTFRIFSTLFRYLYMIVCFLPIVKFQDTLLSQLLPQSISHMRKEQYAILAFYGFLRDALKSYRKEKGSPTDVGFDSSL